MSRTRLSRPVQLTLADGLLSPERTFFDYGCGRGGDIRRLCGGGFRAEGWDPIHRPGEPRVTSDIVNLGYVINVIEDPRERLHALQSAWKLTGSVLVVAARPDWEAALARGHPRGDGILTSAGTFQKFFEQEELRSWIQAGIGVEPVAAAPGIFYVFRSPAEAAGIRARRIRQRAIGVPRPRKADVLWDCHRELLEPLASFWEERGRLPDFAELEEAVEIEKVIGSLRVAASVLKRVLGEERFENARKRAELDLQVFLALEAFRGRSRFNELPRDVTLDVRAHFGNYKNACATADLLLFTLADEERLGGALREANFGKVLPDAVYFHVDYIHRLDPLLRVYEGAARALLGDIEPVTLVKMSRTERRVSYLWYPMFEKEGHPALATSLRADLRSCHVKWTDFRESKNPPVLHRKETFVPEDHPTRLKFERLTQKELREGLLEDPTRIGTRDGWLSELSRAGFSLAGHQLSRTSTIEGS